MNVMDRLHAVAYAILCICITWQKLLLFFMPSCMKTLLVFLHLLAHWLFIAMALFMW